MSKLDLINIEKSYGKKQVIKNLNLSIDKGEILSILGPSGCGKSTLLNIISGVDEDFCGKVIMDQKDITNLKSNKRNIVIVTQENLLFPHMNVYENIAFGLRARGVDKEKIDSKVKSLLFEISLSGYEKKRVDNLSGGEKQRISLARALAVEPEILLLDESFTALDTNLRTKIRALTKKLIRKHCITAILVTHDKQEAYIFSDYIAVMQNGKLFDKKRPEDIYEKSENLLAAKFLQEHNYYQNNDKTYYLPTFNIGLDFEKEDLRDDFCIEYFEDSNIINKNFKFEIIEREFLGEKIRYHLKSGEITMVADDFYKKKFVNEKYLSVNIGKFYIYDKDGNIK